MKRRTVLAGTAVALAGCVGDSNSGGDGGGDDSTDTPSPTPETGITDRSFTERDQCEEQNDASIAVDGDVVRVVGCATGKDGCRGAALDGATYDGDADRLTVAVTTEDDSGTDEACTQALTALGYEAEITVEGPLPGETVVIHDDAKGRREVATAETG